MDFADSPREAVFRAEARAFLEEHAPERVPNPYREDTPEAQRAALPGARAWQRTLCEHGFAGLLWPAEHGGRGLGPIEQTIWNQELARFGLGESVFLGGVGMAGPTIIAHGTQAQCAEHLRPMLRGDLLWTQLFSEPGAGSDLVSLAARGVRDGDDWIISGQKTWSSFAHFADWGYLLVRTDPDAPKHRGITYFLVDMKSPGIDVRPLRQMTGAELFNEVFLEEVRLPDANRLGEAGGGWAVANTTLMYERMVMGGLDRQFSFDALVALARERPGLLDDVTRDQLAQLYTRLKSLELLNARIMTKLGRGENPSTEGSVMKLALARVYSQAAELGLRVQGDDALRGRGAWQRHFLEAPAFHIAGGTDEVQKNIAAERVLGLPRDPHDLRDVPFSQLPRS